MVNKIRICLFFCIFSACQALLGVEIRTDINPMEVVENRDITVKLIVTRNVGQKIDDSSFTFDGKTQEMFFLNDARHSSIVILNGRRKEENLQISSFQFTVPGKVSGLYALPPVTVSVDGKIYTSKQISYEVPKGEKRDDFRIVPFADATVLYPGQRTRVGYQIYFDGNVELNIEDYPLLEAEGFKKIGKKQLETVSKGSYGIYEIVQEIEATDPGKYSFRAAFIEGYAYQLDFFRRKRYVGPRLRAESSPFSINVIAFPKEGKPPHFSGAIGSYLIKTELLSSNSVLVGDKLELKVTLTGSGDLRSVILPDISRQKKFEGKFRLSDLPPSLEMDGLTKEFIVEMRPLFSNITQIPALAFSYFNPKDNSYYTVYSEAIPIVVNESEELAAISLPEVPKAPVQYSQPRETEELASLEIIESEKTETPLHEVGAIEISGILPLNASELSLPSWKQWKALWILPIQLTLLVFLHFFRKKRNAGLNRKRDLLSSDYFEEALKAKSDGTSAFALVEKAFVYKLKEKGLISHDLSSPEQLAKKGIVGEVREFLLGLEEERFAGKDLEFDEALIKQAKTLLERI
jgi:hypothetical protein